MIVLTILYRFSGANDEGVVCEDNSGGGDDVCVNDDSTSDAYGDPFIWLIDFESPVFFWMQQVHIQMMMISCAAEQCCACGGGLESSSSNDVFTYRHSSDGVVKSNLMMVCCYWIVYDLRVMLNLEC